MKLQGSRYTLVLLRWLCRLDGTLYFCVECGAPANGFAARYGDEGWCCSAGCYKKRMDRHEHWRQEGIA